jgi:hypothetical protein
VTFKAAIKLKLLGASFSLLHNNPSCWIWRQVCVFLRCQSWRREWTPHTQNKRTLRLDRELVAEWRCW